METVQRGVKSAPLARKPVDDGLSFPSPEGVRLWLLIGLLITAALLEGTLQHYANGAASSLTPSGIPIFSLQLADTPQHLNHFLKAWDPKGLKISLVVNVFFIVAYAFCIVLLLTEAVKKEQPLRFAAQVLLVCTVAGVVCDFAENGLMLFWACGADPSERAVKLGSVLAILKFVLVIPACVFIILFWDFCKLTRDYIVTTLEIIWAVRFPFFVVGLLGALMIFVGQVSELFRISVHGGVTDPGVHLVPDQHYGFKGAFVFECLAVLAVSLAAWYFARLLLRRTHPDNELWKSYSQDATWHRKYEKWLKRQLPRLIGSSMWVVFAIAVYRSRTVHNFRHLNDLLNRVTIAALIVAVALYFAFYLRRKKFVKEKDVRDYETHPYLLYPSERAPVLIPVALWLVLLFGFAGCPTVFGAWLTPLIVLLLGIGCWIPIGSLLTYAGTRKGVPFLTVLVLAAFAFTALDLNDNHHVRCLPGTNNVTQSVSDYFHEWASNRVGTTPYSYPVFLVAAEGGGIRAAANTAIVLGGLQDSNHDFFDHVFAISGVSGGSVGATVFTAYHRHRQKSAATQIGTYTQFATNFFTNDYLSPMLGMGFFPDLLQRFMFPSIGRFDRTLGLEKAFEDATVDGATLGLTTSYSEWHKSVSDGPALLLNSTDVSSGRRMTIAPFHFGETNYNRPLLLSDVSDTNDLSLSTAMCVSARFPIFTSTGYLIHTGTNTEKHTYGETKHRFVDGGYYENSGTATLLDVLDVLHTNQNCQFYVIRIGAMLESNTNKLTASNGTTNKVAKALPKYSVHGFDEFAPIFAVLNAREARGNDVTYELGDALKICNKTNMIEFTWHEGNVSLPLGWYIGSSACWSLHQQFTNHQAEISLVNSILTNWAFHSSTTAPIARK